MAYSPAEGNRGAAAPAASNDGEVQTYGAADMCASPARDYEYEPLFLHSVVMTGLDPGHSYAYTLPHREPIVFRAMPKTGPRHSFSFVVYGDMGESQHREAKSPG